jgi:hypothetical protein
MKYATTLEEIIFKIKNQRTESINQITKITLAVVICMLESHLPDEREKLEKAFEHGVGEGIDDPERPFTGKEYFELRYGIDTEKK